MKRYIILFLTGLTLAGLQGIGFAQKSNYRVQPSDIVAITVMEQSDLTTKTRISDEGYLTFPLIGKVFVEGLTTQQIEGKIKAMLEDGYLVNAQVAVFIEQYHFKQISVMGEVTKPGKFDMPEEKELTVTEAVAMAGGFSADADIADVKILRMQDGKEQAIQVNMKDITLKGEKEKDVVVEPGDIIVIPKGFWQISVIGEVAKQGKYDMPKERRLTLMEALAMAGGFATDADIANTKVLRTREKEQEVIKININDIIVRDDKDKNIALEPGDIIVVPKGFWQVSVIGEVVKPGKYDMPKERPLTLMQAIATAGGLTKDASTKNVKIIRSEDGREIITKIDVEDITKRNQKEKDIPLKPEDIVYVPESFF